ncbi:hypothetical protein GGS23DRAFT_358867 [Durotheca rogersii]|uniref:uncharacterized protein n=1 Tax=Durotheca rogersii TaxID=419775 RepID=UPI00221F3EBD|nr:uncharacterized protein GGS23DRAFT_358867 [Durotheca rogersii]KAI5865886.1 hypothetical protein GGS23DRAFT_358867 [Durotheca rogersii]
MFAFVPSSAQVVRRQYVEQDGRVIWFWYTRTGVIVKWSIFLGISVLLALYLILGRIHAKRRVRAGLKPLAYHSWLLSRQEKAAVDPRYAWPNATYNAYHSHQAPPPGYGYGSYGMHPMPPPVYDPNNRPPVYEGAGPKVDPTQAAGVEPATGPAAPQR